MLLGLISSNGSRSDVSTSFKRLQAEKLAADSVLCELTPLKSIQDAAALKEYIANVNTKTEVCVHWYTIVSTAHRISTGFTRGAEALERKA